MVLFSHCSDTSFEELTSVAGSQNGEMAWLGGSQCGLAEVDLNFGTVLRSVSCLADVVPLLPRFVPALNLYTSTAIECGAMVVVQ